MSRNTGETSAANGIEANNERNAQTIDAIIHSIHFLAFFAETASSFCTSAKSLNISAAVVVTV